MWLIYREQLDNCKIIHARNGREFRLPELPHLSVDGYCVQTRKVYEFLGCHWHGHTCLPHRDVATQSAGDTLAERYEQTMSRIQQITGAGYEVEVQWECEFDKHILPQHPELQVHPVLEQGPMNTRDALYGGRTEAMRLHHKI